MERRQEQEPRKVDLAPLEERLSEYMRHFENNPDDSSPQRRLGLDCVALAVIAGRLANGADEDVIEEIECFVDDADNMFASPFTPHTIRESLRGNDFGGPDYDYLIKGLNDRIRDYGQLEHGAPSVPAGTLADIVSLVEEVDYHTNLELLKTIFTVYDDETARETFAVSAEELTDLMKVCNDYDRLNSALLRAGALTTAAYDNREIIIPVTSGYYTGVYSRLRNTADLARARLMPLAPPDKNGDNTGGIETIQTNLL